MRTALRSLALAALLLVPVGAARADDDLWLHVRVDGDRGETVSVNLPLALVEKAIPLIPDEHFRHGVLVLDDVEWGHGRRLSVADLRELWSELQASPDMTFVTVESDDEKVRVSKSGGYLLVDAADRGRESVEVRVPLAVVDALLSGDGEALDIRAAIAALARHGGGELVAVNQDDERVRVWIDDSSETD
jgi:hypothetical protein